MRLRKLSTVFAASATLAGMAVLGAAAPAQAVVTFGYDFKTYEVSDDVANGQQTRVVQLPCGELVVIDKWSNGASPQPTSMYAAKSSDVTSDTIIWPATLSADQSRPSHTCRQLPLPAGLHYAGGQPSIGIQNRIKAKFRKQTSSFYYQGQSYSVPTKAADNFGTLIKLPNGQFVVAGGGWAECSPPIPEGIRAATGAETNSPTATIIKAKYA